LAAAGEATRVRLTFLVGRGSGALPLPCARGLGITVHICFDAIVQASATVIPRKQTAVRPDLRSAQPHNPLYTPATIR
jgi:hypothetical protein